MGLNNFQWIAQADEDIRLDAWRDISPILTSACHYSVVAPDNLPQEAVRDQSSIRDGIEGTNNELSSPDTV